MNGDDDLSRRLVGALDEVPEVVAAYLFGSAARGTSTSSSDVDVAVLLDDEAEPRTRLHVISAVQRAVGPRRADVVVLNEAPATLGYRVLRDGIVLIGAQRRERIAHWVRTVDRYLDMAPLRATIAAGVSHRIAEGRFGRP